MAKSPFADVPEPLKTHLPAMFASYPRLAKPTPSSWIVWQADRVAATNSAICHSNMFYYGKGFTDAVTAVPNSSEIALEYLRTLIRGPFRAVSDLIKLDRVGKNYYIHCFGLDKFPANVLMNFMIATRVPIEYKFLLEPWAKRCEHGYDQTLAFLLTYSYGSDYYTEEQYSSRNFSMARPGHMWLDPASDWSNILNGTFVNPSVSYAENPSKGRPTNCIWGVSQDYKKLMSMSDVEVADFYKLPIQSFEKPKPPIWVKVPHPDPYVMQFNFANAIAPAPVVQPPQPGVLANEAAPEVGPNWGFNDQF